MDLNYLLNLFADFFHHSKEVGRGDAIGTLSVRVEDNVDAVLFLCRVLSHFLDGHSSSLGILSHSDKEILKLGSVEKIILVGVIGLESGLKFGHSLRLGLLSLPRLLLCNKLRLVFFTEAVPPVEPLLCERANIHLATIIVSIKIY